MALRTIAEDAAGCTRCDLYQHATQTVFGEGPPDAVIVLVGEQPGDQEDKHGHPFVGPAGRVLDRALADSRLAGESMFGTGYRVGAHKGEIVDATLGDWQGLAIGTIHPSAVLRGSDQAARDTAYAGLVGDLITARDTTASGLSGITDGG